MHWLVLEQVSPIDPRHFPLLHALLRHCVLLEQVAPSLPRQSPSLQEVVLEH
jgi:hypothetical protein